MVYIEYFKITIELYGSFSAHNTILNKTDGVNYAIPPKWRQKHQFIR